MLVLVVNSLSDGFFLYFRFPVVLNESSLQLYRYEAFSDLKIEHLLQESKFCVGCF
jgi:hypothetical protein